MADAIVPDTPTSVYRFYDARSVLIYVGITSRGVTRQRQHNSDKEWWPFVVAQKVDHFPTRAAAHEREVALIKRWEPPFNKQHNKRHAQLRALYLGLDGGVPQPLTVKECALRGIKTIRLIPVRSDQGESLVSDPADSLVVEALRDVAGTPVLDKFNRTIGSIKQFSRAGHSATFELRRRLGVHPILSAVATIKYTSLKKPCVTGLRKVEVTLGPET